MRILFGQVLVAKLQELGISTDHYQTIADVVYNALGQIEDDLRVDDCLQMPNGTTLQVTYKVK